MAVKKPESKEPSCPLWLATYGDMVTNMLVFFVLLLSMSEIKRDDRFIDFMQALREAFGYVGGLEVVPYERVFQPKNVDLAEMLVIPVNPESWSQSRDPGVRGKQPTVRDIRREDKFSLGGRFQFSELSADLLPEHAPLIDEYVEKLKGHRMQIELRGHCSAFPVAGSPFEDHFQLSLARARAIARELVARGIDARRIVVVGAGANEPVATDAYTLPERQRNDRVEVLQVNVYVEEFQSEAPPLDEPTPAAVAPEAPTDLTPAPPPGSAG